MFSIRETTTTLCLAAVVNMFTYSYAVGYGIEELSDGAFITQLSINADGDMWGTHAIRTDKGDGVIDPAGSSIFRKKKGDDKWSKVSGFGWSVAATADGGAWLTNFHGDIFRFKNNRWEIQPGTAQEVDVGPDGTVWVVGKHIDPAGGAIFKWTGSAWQRYPGWAIKVAGTPTGSIWVINRHHQIFELVNGAWIQRPGHADDIDVGPDGSVWIVGNKGEGVFNWNGTNWIRYSNQDALGETYNNKFDDVAVESNGNSLATHGGGIVRFVKK